MNKTELILTRYAVSFLKANLDSDNLENLEEKGIETTAEGIEASLEELERSLVNKISVSEPLPLGFMQRMQEMSEELRQIFLCLDSIGEIDYDMAEHARQCAIESIRKSIEDIGWAVRYMDYIHSQYFPTEFVGELNKLQQNAVPTSENQDS
ncbi:MAG TPA: hypothetical protein V6C65_23625 [Allocoleopsis sp.]